MKLKNHHVIFFSILVSVILAGALILNACSAPSQVKPPASQSSGAGKALTSVPAPAPMAPSFARNNAETVTSSSDTLVPDDRRIVRTGNLSLEVESITTAINRVGSIARDVSGYVVNSRRSGEKEFAQGYVSIRVPVEKFDDTIQKLRAIAIRINNESQQSQDVTQEYVDIKAQLGNLEATEKQFLALLNKAQTVEDILKVQKELSRVRGEIERTKARVLYLERTSDTSLIEVNLEEPKPIAESGWSILDTIKSAASGAVSFGRFLLELAIWLLVFIWLWLPAIFLFRWWRKRQKKTA